MTAPVFPAIHLLHMIGPRGLADTLPALAARIVEHAPLTAGLALVENAQKRLSHVEVVAPADFAAADQRLLAVTEKTGGNGIGVGMADYMPMAMANALDLRVMYMNAVTATILEKARIPIVLPDEITVFRAMVVTCWASGAPRLCQIVSSAQLDQIAVTENLLPELEAKGVLIDRGDPAPLRFDDTGTLLTRIES